MSAKKGFETDENTDSGFLSGLISEPLTEEFDDEAPKPESDSKKVTSETDQTVDLDSGLCLTDHLDALRVCDATPTAVAPTIATATVTEEIPPLAILFQQDDDGDTQLHIAAVHGCEKSVSTLIRVCPDRYWLDLPNDFGHTALHLAVMSGHAVVTRMLVRAGASLGVRDLNGDTPLHAATARRRVECLQALLAPIENQPLQKKLAGVLNQKNYDGQTCVHLAATSGHLDTLQTLIYYGADINASEGLAGWTPLHIAVRRGDVHLTQHLLQRCPAVAPAARDYAGRTPRRLAKRTKAFTTKEGQRLFANLPEDSDSDTDTDNEYDSDSDVETLFDKLRGSMTAASLVTN